jgi:Tfp pilus assembly protein PilN
MQWNGLGYHQELEQTLELKMSMLLAICNNTLIVGQTEEVLLQGKAPTIRELRDCGLTSEELLSDTLNISSIT